MPVLFVGHGSPMYAIEKNEFEFYRCSRLILLQRTEFPGYKIGKI